VDAFGDSGAVVKAPDGIFGGFNTQGLKHNRYPVSGSPGKAPSRLGLRNKGEDLNVSVPEIGTAVDRYIGGLDVKSRKIADVLNGLSEGLEVSCFGLHGNRSKTER
jgi:hypothetical protein